MGPIGFRRRAWRCSNPDCRAFVAPLDRELGLAPKEHATTGAREKIALVGATESYRDAELKLESLAGLKACAKQIQRITCKEGERARQLIEEQHREARLQKTCAERHATAVLQMDGTCTMTQPGGPRVKRQEQSGNREKTPVRRSAGKEVKCATVFGLDQRVQPPARPMLSGRRYAATSLGIEVFAAMVFALLLSYGGRKSRRIVVLGDGAAWIWKWVRDWLLPWTKQGVEVVEIVDFWHAAEHLGTLAKSLFGDGTAAAQQWLEQWRHRLRLGGIDDLLAELGELRGKWKSGRRHEACRTELNYFTEHAERMRYDRYEAQGLPIGSGAIEGTCKNLVKKRMSACGMHWRPDLIEPIVALRTILFNQDWRLLYPQPA